MIHLSLPPSDGRVFVWVKGSFGQLQPMIIHQPGVGMQQEHLARYVLKSSEYMDSLTTLANRYPAPEIKEEE